MRNIRFRGKTMDKQWVHGYPSKNVYQDKTQIIVGNQNHLVDEKTVDQWTGLNDINGEPIYENDIVESIFKYDAVCNGGVIPDNDAVVWGIVKFIDFKFVVMIIKSDTPQLFEDLEYLDIVDYDGCYEPETWKVLGNTHDDNKILIELNENKS